MKKSKTLVLASTLNEKALKPFWNESCRETSSELWLPTQTGLQDQDMNSLNGSLNHLEVQSNHWMTQIMMKNNSTPLPSYLLSPASVRPFMEKGVPELRQVITKKIRIIPENEEIYTAACDLARASYNMCISAYINYKEDVRTDPEIRHDVTASCKDWQLVIAHITDGSAYNAKITKQKVIKERTKGKKCGYHFKTRKDSRQGFNISKLPKKWIYPQKLGPVTFLEEIPEYAFGRSARVITEYGEWYLCCQDVIIIPKIKARKLSAVAIDPGVRTFATTYSPDTVCEYGADYAKQLKVIQVELDHAISQRALILNQKKQYKNMQWYQDKIKHWTNTINKCKIDARNLIDNMHKQIAAHLTKNYDVILLPTFEVSNMVDKQRRSIGRETVRGMLGLSHFRFKCILKWHAKKRGKLVLDVNESYTSKTNSFTGELMDIGSKKQFKHDGQTFDRDINAAKNIFIKHIKIK